MEKIKQRGQMMLMLLLVMTLGLGVALSIIGRSLSDISTSTKTEQSSRAFSAAEAGIENALKGDTTNVNFADNQSQATVSNSQLLPAPTQGLEYPPISKEEVAQIWLANQNDLSDYYNQNSITVYWGTPGLSNANKAAIEIKLFYKDVTNTIKVAPFYYDPVPAQRANPQNGFIQPVNCNDTSGVTASNTTSGTNRTFYCSQTINLSSFAPHLIMMRFRLLYTSVAQPVALMPVGNCGLNCSLPPQAQIFTSTGTAGDTQRTVQLFKLDKTLPFYFDYAIFSQGDIQK